MRTALTIALSMLATIIALATSTADAYSTYRSHSAMSCMPLNQNSGPPYDYWSGGVSGGNGSVQNSSSTSTMSAFCPIISDSTVSATASTATVTLYGYSNADASVLPYACVSYYIGGGNCTQMSYVTAVGTWFSSSVTAPSAWSGRYVSDGYYLQVFLDATSSNGDTAIWSYDLTN